MNKALDAKIAWRMVYGGSTWWEDALQYNYFLDLEIKKSLGQTPM